MQCERVYKIPSMLYGQAGFNVSRIPTEQRIASAAPAPPLAELWSQFGGPTLAGWPAADVRGALPAVNLSPAAVASAQVAWRGATQPFVYPARSPSAGSAAGLLPPMFGFGAASVPAVLPLRELSGRLPMERLVESGTFGVASAAAAAAGTAAAAAALDAVATAAPNLHAPTPQRAAPPPLAPMSLPVDAVPFLLRVPLFGRELADPPVPVQLASAGEEPPVAAVVVRADAAVRPVLPASAGSAVPRSAFSAPTAASPLLRSPRKRAIGVVGSVAPPPVAGDDAGPSPSSQRRRQRRFAPDGDAHAAAGRPSPAAAAAAADDVPQPRVGEGAGEEAKDLERSAEEEPWKHEWGWRGHAHYETRRISSEQHAVRPAITRAAPGSGVTPLRRSPLPPFASAEDAMDRAGLPVQLPRARYTDPQQ